MYREHEEPLEREIKPVSDEEPNSLVLYQPLPFSISDHETSTVRHHPAQINRELSTACMATLWALGLGVATPSRALDKVRLEKL